MAAILGELFICERRKLIQMIQIKMFKNVVYILTQKMLMYKLYLYLIAEENKLIFLENQSPKVK